MFNRKIIFALFCLFPFAAWSENSEQTELSAIEKRIQAIKVGLHHDRLTELDEEVKGQKYMIGNWDTYGNELERIHKQKEADKQIESELKQLEQRRADLLKQTQKKV